MLRTVSLLNDFVRGNCRLEDYDAESHNIIVQRLVAAISRVPHAEVSRGAERRAAAVVVGANFPHAESSRAAERRAAAVVVGNDDGWSPNRAGAVYGGNVGRYDDLRDGQPSTPSTDDEDEERRQLNEFARSRRLIRRNEVETRQHFVERIAASISRVPVVGTTIPHAKSSQADEIRAAAASINQGLVVGANPPHTETRAFKLMNSLGSESLLAYGALGCLLKYMPSSKYPMERIKLLTDAAGIVETVLGIRIDQMAQLVDLVPCLKDLLCCFPNFIDLCTLRDGYYLESQAPEFQAQLEETKD
ncbi:hypothetical protein OROHE_023033 [Orobanche hederae]